MDFDPILMNEKIVGTSKSFRSKKLCIEEPEGSDSGGGNSRIPSFTPSTPPPAATATYRTAKRRKGVPHRAPLGALIIQY